jgi:hypothetical protein
MFVDEHYLHRGEIGRWIVERLHDHWRNFLSEDPARTREGLDTYFSQDDLTFTAIYKGITDGLLGYFAPTKENESTDETTQIQAYAEEFLKTPSALDIFKRIMNENDPYQIRLMIFALYQHRGNLRPEPLNLELKENLKPILYSHVEQWKEWIKTKERNPEQISIIRQSFQEQMHLAIARSELRRLDMANIESNLDKTIHLRNDVIFTIGAATLEKLARAHKGDGYDQWLELLGLKMLNEDRLHIVIDVEPEQALGNRGMELRFGGHKNVYLGWGARTLAALPKNAPVIEFEKLLSGELLKERTRRQVDVTFDVFDGAFIAALRYAQNPTQLAWARQRMKVITSASATDMGLLDQLFKTYEIVSQAA